MKTITFDKLILKTAFCCMVSDGDIDKNEVDAIKAICKDLPSFQNVDLNDEMNLYVSEINADSKKFIENCYKLLESSDLTEQEELTLIDIAIKVIKADEIIEYSEIKFFKTIRYRLKISDEKIIEFFSTIDDIEQFLGEDIQISLDKITTQYFDTIKLPEFDFVTINIDKTINQ
jgi:uncharacterized tellurite resistance protein B-like protein